MKIGPAMFLEGGRSSINVAFLIIIRAAGSGNLCLTENIAKAVTIRMLGGKAMRVVVIAAVLLFGVVQWLREVRMPSGVVDLGPFASVGSFIGQLNLLLPSFPDNVFFCVLLEKSSVARVAERTTWLHSTPLYVGRSSVLFHVAVLVL